MVSGWKLHLRSAGRVWCRNARHRIPLDRKGKVTSDSNLLLHAQQPLHDRVWIRSPKSETQREAKSGGFLHRLSTSMSEAGSRDLKMGQGCQSV